MSKQTLLEELKRFNEINHYVKKLVNEQEDTVDTNVPPTSPNNLPTDTGQQDPTLGQPVDNTVSADNVETTVDPMTDEDTTEEIDITDLVNLTKSIKKSVEEKGDNNSGLEKMDDVFTKLSDIELKLNGMNELIEKIDHLEATVNNSRPKTPEEKLEMRSIDSYPFSQNPQEFFDEKIPQMRDSGKNEYVLTKDDVQNYSKNGIIQSFNPDLDKNLY